MIKHLAVSGLLLLAGCAMSPDETSLLPPSAPGIAVSDVNQTTEHFEFGTLSSSAWVSDTFNGAKARQFRDQTLFFSVAQDAPEGGLDVGLTDLEDTPRSVAEAKSGLAVCTSYGTELNGDGRWWAGPKISVNWQGDEAAKQNGDDWYENYVVEIASSTPQELHEIFTGDYFQAEVLPDLTLDGSTYRNYKIRFHSWWQFWSVRQDYRAKGTLALEPILDTWIAHGLPQDRVFDGVKANIETYGPISGYGWMNFDRVAADTPTDCVR
ncbi:MAG: hypothetical protein ACX94B_16135 [Henriciella sp.]